MSVIAFLATCVEIIELSVRRDMHLFVEILRISTTGDYITAYRQEAIFVTAFSGLSLELTRTLETRINYEVHLVDFQKFQQIDDK
jgi:hypothetical protein